MKIFFALAAVTAISIPQAAKAEASDPRYPTFNQSTPRAHAARLHHYRHQPRARKQLDANGNAATSGRVVSHKTGATANVSTKYAAQFQAYIDDLEASGAAVSFMGGYRRGVCSSRHLHSCNGGEALDVCQLSRGRVDPRCRLPGRAEIAKIAERHGLFEGGRWCSSDYGHAQARISAGDCGRNLYAAVEKFKRQKRHTRHSIAMGG